MSLRSLMDIYFTLDQSSFEEFEKLAVLKVFPKRTMLVEQGKVSHSFFMIKKGIIRVGITKANGEEDIMMFGSNGDPYMSLPSYLHQKPAVCFVECVTDVEAYVVNLVKLKELEERSFGFAKWMMTVLYAQLEALELKYYYFIDKDINSRYAAFINHRGLASQLPVKYIAQYLGVSPETLSRTRARLSSGDND